jgi:hypothetical protein
MKKEHIGFLPSFYQGYVDCVEDIEVMEALKNALIQLESIDIAEWSKLDQRAYFPGKWTLNEVIQHMIDTERVFAYRALVFAREDQVELPGFNEDAYAAHSYANDRTIPVLIEEFIALRKSTILMFGGFSEKTLKNSGVANGNRIEVLALGFVLAGHQNHHMNVINDRYLVLL